MKSFIESIFSSERTERVGFESMEHLPSYEEPNIVTNDDKEEDTIDEISVSSEITLIELVIPENVGEPEIKPSAPVPAPSPVSSDVKEDVIDSEPVSTKPNRCLTNCNIM